MPVIKMSMSKEWYQILSWIKKTGGFQADIPALRRAYPEVHLTSLEEWLRKERLEGKREVTVKRDKNGRPISAN
jgi:hypothetical protein